MVRFFITAMVAAATTAAGDIVVSKDSLLVNAFDTVTITNTGANQVYIDSVVFRFDLLDSFQPPCTSADRFDVSIVELFNGSPITHSGVFDTLGVNLFAYTFEVESRPPFPVSPGGTTGLANVRLGSFMRTAVSKFPKYLEGTLYLYFNNASADSLRIRSNDLRTAAAANFRPVPARKELSNVSRRFLINGQMVADGTVEVVRRRCTHRWYSFPSVR
jgi:hypothetical protein